MPSLSGAIAEEVVTFKSQSSAFSLSLTLFTLILSHPKKCQFLVRDPDFVSGIKQI